MTGERFQNFEKRLVAHTKCMVAHWPRVGPLWAETGPEGIVRVDDTRNGSRYGSKRISLWGSSPCDRFSKFFGCIPLTERGGVP